MFKQILELLFNVFDNLQVFIMLTKFIFKLFLYSSMIKYL